MSTVGGTLVASSPRDFRGSSKNNERVQRGSTITAVFWRSLSSRNFLLVALSAIKLGIAESNDLAGLPSGFKCIWIELPHAVQFAILLLMMLGLLCGVCQLFDKVDKALHARLSCATTAWMEEINQAPRRTCPRQDGPLPSS